MILIRYLLISLIVYLLIRSFFRYFSEEDHSKREVEPEKDAKSDRKKISKEVGEYIDYEEIDNK